jgi:energy-coupling factor transporter transmembrane protein EcfT
VLLARLSQLNPTTVFLAMAALVIAGLLAPWPVGGILLLAIAGALAALLSVTWAHGTPRTRAARAVILALLVALAVVRLV